jgi:16S rRNA (guanine1207-N2)-methyltransferase
MVSEHYFSVTPGSEPGLRKFHARLVGQTYELTTGTGIFSPERIDVGTEVLLTHVPPPPPGGHLIDLGCGWGPIALSLAIQSPHATVWAVDVNERALELVRMNAAALGLTNVNASTPDDVPDDVRFMTLWSNPPIRVGKNELHGLLERWLPRLEPGTDAWLVVQRNLGSDSLHRWLQASFPDDYTFTRAATNKGYRVLRGRKRA